MDHVIRDDFKNIFKHVEMLLEPWRAFLRALKAFFSKNAQLKFSVPGPGTEKNFFQDLSGNEKIELGTFFDAL